MLDRLLLPLVALDPDGQLAPAAVQRVPLTSGIRTASRRVLR